MRFAAQAQHVADIDNRADQVCREWRRRSVFSGRAITCTSITCFIRRPQGLDAIVADRHNHLLSRPHPRPWPIRAPPASLSALDMEKVVPVDPKRPEVIATRPPSPWIAAFDDIHSNPAARQARHFVARSKNPAGTTGCLSARIAEFGVARRSRPFSIAFSRTLARSDPGTVIAHGDLSVRCPESGDQPTAMKQTTMTLAMHCSIRSGPARIRRPLVDRVAAPYGSADRRVLAISDSVIEWATSPYTWSQSGEPDRADFLAASLASSQNRCDTNALKQRLLTVLVRSDRPRTLSPEMIARS